MCFLFPSKTPDLDQVDRQKEQWESKKKKKKKNLKLPVHLSRLAIVDVMPVRVWPLEGDHWVIHG